MSSDPSGVRRPLARRVGPALLACIGLGLSVSAQDTKPPPAPEEGQETQEAPQEEPAAEQPTFIPIAEVAGRAAGVEEEIRSVETELASVEEARAALIAASTALAGEVEAAHEQFDASVERRARAGELGAVQSRWSHFDERFAEGERLLGEQANKLGEVLDDIRRRKDLWRRTQVAATEAEAPDNILGEITGAFAELERIERAVENSRNATLALQGEDKGSRRTIRAALEQIEAEREARAGSFFERQEGAIWTLSIGDADIPLLLENLREDVRLIGAGFWEYARLHIERIVLHVLGILLLGGYLQRLRTEARRATGQEQAEKAGWVPASTDYLRHPWGAALVVGLFLTPFIQVDRVQGLMVVVLLLGLFALVRLLRSELPAEFRFPLLGLAALGLAEILRTVIGSQDAFARWCLVLELSAGLVGVLWFLRPARQQILLEQIGKGIWHRIARAWLRLLVPAFAVGIAATVLGYMRLADTLGLLTAWGTLSGVAFLAISAISSMVARSLIDAGRLDGLHMVRARKELVLRMVSKALRVTCFSLWAFLVLRAGSLLDPLIGFVDALLATSLGYGAFALELGDLIAFCVTLWISWLLARFVSFALHQEVFSRLQTAAGIPFAIATFTRYGILVVGFLLAMSILGFPIDRATMLISALGVGIGFGLQNVVNNFVSGIILLFERPVRVGDRIQLDQLKGDVTTIGIRATKVRTFDGSEVIVPNGDLISGQLINWTLGDRRVRTTIEVGVAYGTDPRRVLDILRSVCEDHERVLDSPEPLLLFVGFGDSSLDFELRFWADTRDRPLIIQSELTLAINDALADADIRIPFPQRDLHLRTAGEPTDLIAPPGTGIVSASGEDRPAAGAGRAGNEEGRGSASDPRPPGSERGSGPRSRRD